MTSFELKSLNGSCPSYKSDSCDYGPHLQGNSGEESQNWIINSVSTVRSTSSLAPPCNLKWTAPYTWTSPRSATTAGRRKQLKVSSSSHPTRTAVYKGTFGNVKLFWLSAMKCSHCQGICFRWGYGSWPNYDKHRTSIEKQKPRAAFAPSPLAIRTCLHFHAIIHVYLFCPHPTPHDIMRQGNTIIMDWPKP